MVDVVTDFVLSVSQRIDSSIQHTNLLHEADDGCTYRAHTDR